MHHPPPPAAPDVDALRRHARMLRRAAGELERIADEVVRNRDNPPTVDAQRVVLQCIAPVVKWGRGVVE